MKTRFFTVAAIAVLLLNVVGFSSGDSRRNRVTNPQVTRLVSMLPASDAVAVFDTKRFLTDALPKVLAANQPMFTRITAHLTEMENRTGIDVRKFDQVAVGVDVKQISAQETDYDTVAVASGDINFGALVAAAKIASKGAYRTESVGQKSMFIFSVKEVAQKTAQTQNSKAAKVIDHLSNGFSKEIAITSIDKNTLAMGSVPRVRETIEGSTHVGSDLTSLLSTKGTAVMSFAAKSPVGLSKMLSLDNDDLGATVNSIQYMSGSIDVAAVGTSLQMMARTAKPDQAVALKDTLEGLQMLGKAFLGNSKNPDHQIYGRMIKNAKFAIIGSDVTLDLLVPQADIDLLVAKIK